jgi:hypothetical protein
MFERVPKVRRGDLPSTSAYNSIATVVNRVAKGFNGTNLAKFCGSSFQADLAPPPWEQFAVELDTKERDDDNNIIEDSWVCHLRYWDFSEEKWQTAEDATNQKILVDVSDLERYPSVAKGDVLTVYWNSQRGKFVPMVREPGLFPFALKQDLTWNSDTDIYKRYQAWPLDQDWNIRTLEGSVIRDTSAIFYVIDPLGMFRGVGTDSADYAESLPTTGWCCSWGTYRDEETGKETPLYAIVQMQPQIQFFYVRVAARPGDEEDECYGPTDEIVYIDPITIEFTSPVGGQWNHPGDLSQDQPNRCVNVTKQHFDVGERVLVSWNETRIQDNEKRTEPHWDIIKLSNHERWFLLYGDLVYPGGSSTPYVEEYEPLLPDETNDKRLYYPKAFQDGDGNYEGLPRLRSDMWVTASLVQGEWWINDNPQTVYRGVIYGVSLSAGGSTQVKVLSNGYTVTVTAHDYLLCKGEKLDTLTRVLIEWFADENAWFVIGADCCTTTTRQTDPFEGNPF